jgi:hypothetical protein
LEKREDMGDVEIAGLAKMIWIGAIKYGYLKKSRETDVIFDWDEFMTFTNKPNFPERHSTMWNVWLKKKILIVVPHSTTWYHGYMLRYSTVYEKVRF